MIISRSSFSLELYKKIIHNYLLTTHFLRYLNISRMQHMLKVIRFSYKSSPYQILSVAKSVFYFFLFKLHDPLIFMCNTYLGQPTTNPVFFLFFLPPTLFSKSTPLPYLSFLFFTQNLQ
jgi:hypothetical protein